jgi:uncharacterized protein YdcH (DUF465 family)
VVIHREDRAWSRLADKKESICDEIEEMRGPGRRQRAKEELSLVRKGRAEKTPPRVGDGHV